MSQLITGILIKVDKVLRASDSSSRESLNLKTVLILIFQDSKIATYARMWQYMEQNNNVWSASNKEGVERVLKEDGQYAFMMESTVVDYVVERQCELTQVGGLLDNKGYGIGLPPSKSRVFLCEHCGDF